MFKLILNRNKIIVTLIILLSLLPIIGSLFLYYSPQLSHFKTTNHGVLLRPSVNLQTCWPQAMINQWQILYIPQYVNSEKTKSIIHLLHQIYVALGEDSRRVIITIATVDKINSTDPNYRVLRYNKQKDLLKLSESFVLTNKIYLIDPMGNFVMYFSDNADPMGILKDMKLLLKTSQIG